MINGTIEQSGEWPVIRFERRLAISQERVWRAITDPAELRRWLAEVELSLVVGGKFELRFPFRSDEEPSAGSVTALEPGRMIEFTWFPAQLGDSRGDQEGIPGPRPQAPSRSQSGRQGGRGEVQGGCRCLEGTLGSGRSACLRRRDGERWDARTARARVRRERQFPALR